MIGATIEQALRQLKEAREQYAWELACAPQGKLVHVCAKDYERYYVESRSKGETVRRGITHDTQLIHELARKQSS